TAEARNLVDEWLEANPYDSEALHSSALLAADAGHWQGVTALLDRIPLDQRTAAINDLYQSADYRAQISQATSWAHVGEKTKALAALSRIEAAAANDVDVL